MSTQATAAGLLAAIWRLGLLLLFATAFFYLSPLLLTSYDEGIVLTGAFRVGAGEVPGRDFYANYGPAQFYLLHWLMTLFGEDASVARAYDATVAAGIVLAGLALLPNKSGLATRLILGSCFFLLLAAFRAPLYPLTPCFLLTLLACRQQELFLTEGGQLGHACAAGALAGGTLLFRYDIGGATFLMLAISIALFQLDGMSGKPADDQPSNRRLALAFIMQGLALPGLALILLLHLEVFPHALQQLLAYNGVNYVEMRSLPFPAFFGPEAAPVAALLVSFPLLVLFITLAWAAPVNVRRSAIWRERQPLIFLLFMAIVLYAAKGWVRISPTHNLPAILASVLLLCVLMESLSPDRPLRFAAKVKATIAPLTLSCLLLLVALIAVPRIWLPPKPISLERIKVFAEAQAEVPQLGSFVRPLAEVEAVSYVKKRTSSDDRILVAVGHHDRIFVNNVLFYFLAQRLPATRWHHYDPGVQTTAEVQAEMIEEIELTPPPLIVVDRRFDEVREKNKSAESSDVTLLDEHIQRHYHPAASFGTIEVWERRRGNP